jgi:hypothetical protein
VPAAIKYRDVVADAETQNAREVFGLAPRERHGVVAGVQVRREKPMHGWIIRFQEPV